MTIYGVGNYQPSPSFAFPRRYITQVVFGFGAVLSVTGTGPNWVFQDAGDPNNRVHIDLHPTIWGSRNYPLSLDHAMDSWYLTYGPPPTPLPLNFNMMIRYDLFPGQPSLTIWLTGAFNWFAYPIPPSPSGYWLPDLL